MKKIENTEFTDPAKAAELFLQKADTVLHFCLEQNITAHTDCFSAFVAGFLVGDKKLSRRVFSLSCSREKNRLSVIIDFFTVEFILPSIRQIICGELVIINSGSSAAYEPSSNLVSDYSIIRNPSTPVAFPSGPTEFKPGIIYVFTYDGTNLVMENCC